MPDRTMCDLCRTHIPPGAPKWYRTIDLRTTILVCDTCSEAGKR